MVTLVPMTEEEFKVWLAKAAQAYAEENIEAGYWSEDTAQAQSDETFAKLLPAGLSSENNYLLMVQDDGIGAKVGTLWFAILGTSSRPPAFVYDFEIFEQYRRHGYGMQALQALDERVKQMGLDTVQLHVFAHNTTARSLYERAGYVVSSLNMRKELGT